MMKELNADLESGTLKPVYLLYGDESYLKRHYRGRFEKLLAGEDGMNLSVFEGKDISEDAVIDSADTLPFFAERRLIIVEESGWFKSSLERLPDYLAVMPETTVLLFLESAVDKRNRLYKAVQKRGCLCELTHPDERGLSLWAARYLARAGKKITASTMERFLGYVGDDMENVKNELEKLISYLGEREVVELRDVDTITSITLTNRIFEMVNAITAHRTAEAMRLYEDLLALKEPPMRILFLIARQYHQLRAVKELALSGKNKNEIAKLLKLPAFVAARMMAQVRPHPEAALSGMVRRCVELEERVKTGDMQDRLAVELLICGCELV